MSRPVARLGAPSNHGGVIISSACRTMANGILVARMGDLHACPSFYDKGGAEVIVRFSAFLGNLVKLICACNKRVSSNFT